MQEKVRRIEPPEPAMSQARAKASGGNWGLAPTQSYFLDSILCDPNKVYDLEPEYSFTVDKKDFEGTVLFPKLNGQPQAGPVAVFCHGNPGTLLATVDTLHQKEFLYLQRCLASNGIVAISVNVRFGLPADKAENLKIHLENLVTEIKAQKNVDLSNQKLGLIGHSQGGQAVRIVADAIAHGTPLGGFSTVQAIACLATYHDSVAFINDGKAISESLLVIHGVFDGDQKSGEGVLAYEFTRKSVTSYSGLVWIHGATHSSFADKSVVAPLKYDGAILNPADASRNLSPGTVNWLTQTYVTAFFKWRFFGSDFGPLFRGEVLPSLSTLPQDSAVDKFRLHLQPPLYSGGKRTDIFAKNLNPENFFTALNFINTIIYATMTFHCATTFHPSSGFILKWDTAQKPNPVFRFNLPNAKLPHPLSDKFICFDCVRVVESKLNNPLLSATVKILLLSTAFGFPNITLKIADSQAMVTRIPWDGPSLSKTVLSTVRVRLGDIPGATLAFLNGLSGVSLIFGGTAQGEVLLSDLRICS